ncbi:EAL domain-containing protein [Litoribacillus peritrichatus]|uniref:EAL domain-containing protein n=1 Tax=Litoribacillus peritrichatus TaxID=718191 RepID=A0ABP7M6L9_9GAMM
MSRVSFGSFLTLMVWLILPCHTTADLIIDPKEPYVDVRGSVQYLIETDGPLSIEEIKRPAIHSRFQLMPTPDTNFGVVNQVYWFKIPLNYQGSESTVWLLELKHYYLDHIEFYPSAQAQAIITGDNYPFAQRPMEHPSYLFPVTLTPGENHTLYFRIETSTSLHMPLTLWQPEPFALATGQERILQGIFYGTLLVMLFYNFLIYTWVRDTSYLYYSGYVLFIILAWISIDGLGFKLLWPDSPTFSNVSVSLFLNTTALLAILFAREFLNLKSFSPPWNKLLLVLIGVSVLANIPTLSGAYGLGLKLTMSTIFGMCLLFVVLGLYGCYRKQRRAYFFLSAWLLLCIGGVLKSLMTIGVLPVVWTTIYAAQFGIVLEAILLSVALADRMNQDRKAKLEAIESALKASETAIDALEETRATQDKLVYQGWHDPLTGYPNRFLLSTHLQAKIKEAESSQHHLSLACIQLNNFSEINHTLGHDTGDELLCHFIRGLEAFVSHWENLSCIEQTHNTRFHVALIEGVCFGLVFQLEPETMIEPQLQKLQAFLNRPVEFNNMAVVLGGQIGMVKWPEHGNTPETLLRKGMIAMRTAKAAGRAYQIYEDSIDKYSAQRLSLMAELGTAILEDQLELFYQPKISLHNRKVVSLEALIRWNHPKHGLLGPDKFISFAERTMVIHALTHWVLEHSIAFTKRLENKGFQLSIAVNVSVRNLLEDDFVDNVKTLLDRYQLAPEKLVMEMVESAMIEDIELTLATLNQLHALGIQLAIDDFGTGYSSLEYLKKLPVHELKIDRSFVRDMVHDRDDRLIVSTTLVIAHNLGMRVVAEGIEDEATMNLLGEMACELGQGYFISRPIQEDKLIAFLEESSNDKTTPFDQD